MQKKYYVVSADIYLLMQEWAKQNDFVLPEKEFFVQLRKDFSSYMKGIFPAFEIVSEQEISRGLADLVHESDLPVISLDRVYFKSELNLEITRLVDEQRKDRGLGHRAGTPPIWQQIKKLQMSGVHAAALVDDVIFTGGVLERVIELLSRINIRVKLICAGIAIGEGIARLGTKSEVRCVRTYQEVIDEVCERDFYPGVPLSGRLVAGSQNVGVPYILPFGKPAIWASIPAQQTTDFSKFCIQQTMKLFAEIERASDKEIFCRNLGRKVVGLPLGAHYTDALREIL